MSLGRNSASIHEEEKGDDDTFEALFYNKEEAAAFKAGKAPANNLDQSTIEWS
jgi:hypothetical protein